jgi:hypothetical protein
MSEMENLKEQLVESKKIRRAAIRAQRKLYNGYHPCQARAEDPAIDAAFRATEKATEACNVIIDRINAIMDAAERADDEATA